MKYLSTRGTAPVLTFDEVLLAGLAADGGLYVPERWPAISLPALAGRPYAELATEVMWPYVDGAVDRAAFGSMIDESYATFDHQAVAPLRQLGPNEWLLELFHGPTLAFKDVALQLVGRLFDAELRRRRERVTILVATSGDTGSAAIDACRGRDAIDIVVLHPRGRVSDVQRRQMTTVADENVHNLAVEGTFDDCQDLVKAMFADDGFRDELRLSAMNSINWARVMPQVAYYVAAAVALGGGPLAFSVPTGNFGNVYSAWVAKQMGVPITQLVVGSNVNDILTRFLDSGRMEMHDVVETTSPSMDIQVSSNFERLLFELDERNGHLVADQLGRFRGEGAFEIEERQLREVRELFDGARVDDAEAAAVIRELHQHTGELLDPHTAVGVGAARRTRRDAAVPMVNVATAHPAKFPDAVEAAVGIRPPLPTRLSDLFDREERMTEVANDLTSVEAAIRAMVSR